MTAPAQISQSKSTAKTILLATLIAGISDASAAMINYKINVPDGNPLKVWRYVASGVFGNDSLSKDLVTMAIPGLLFHFIIAFLFTLFFFFILPKIKALQKNLIISGLLYGIFVWIVMNLIIVPFSNVPVKGKLWAIVNTDGRVHTIFQLPSNYKQMIIGILIIMFCIGLPIALAIGNYYRKKDKVSY